MKRTILVTLALVVALAVPLAAPAWAQGGQVATGDTYVVQPGDTLIHIAARHGLTATQLAAANGLRWDAWVYAGQRIKVPTPAAGATGGTSSAAPAAAGATGGTYVVRRGDSLSSISRRHGVTVAQLAAANNLRANAWVYTGQKLKVPAPSSGASASAGSSAAPAAAGATGSTYIVRPGDTLLRIAMRHGLTVQRLAMANGMHVNAWVYIGQRLKIPDPSASPSSAPAAAPSAPASPAAAGATGGTYVVRPGDSLIGIAVRHGIGVGSLAATNGLQATAWVYVGQRLKIPAPSAAPAAPQPQPKPTAAPAQPKGEKWIDIDLSAQTLTAFVGDQAVFHAVVSTGTSRTPTVVGTYRVYSKYVSTSMSGPGYYLPNVPHVMFFYRGYSIHGTYWHNNFGTPMSHGCVNMTRADAKWLYEWAPMGIKVVTHR